ncbi:hypothetical protein AGMMS49574_12600 [Bacteroidia bacterium]|nr:hypothetical protein AGMMS49574_12600 [Bacteroidia bacterium]GHU59052.1 hypothetical protein FACS189411_15430 [Bacteroidia bacterium]
MLSLIVKKYYLSNKSVSFSRSVLAYWLYLRQFGLRGEVQYELIRLSANLIKLLLLCQTFQEDHFFKKELPQPQL